MRLTEKSLLRLFRWPPRDTDSNKDESIIATSDSEGNENASESEQNDSSSSLASDTEQYERMQAYCSWS